MSIDVLLICLTVLVLAWILGERWYAHRDRSYAKLTRDCAATVTGVEQACARALKQTQDDAADIVAQAHARVEATLAHHRALEARMDTAEAQLKGRAILGRGR